jgi:hypothetical protein
MDVPLSPPARLLSEDLAVLFQDAPRSEARRCSWLVRSRLLHPGRLHDTQGPDHCSNRRLHPAEGFAEREISLIRAAQAR